MVEVRYDTHAIPRAEGPDPHPPHKVAKVLQPAEINHTSPGHPLKHFAQQPKSNGSAPIAVTDTYAPLDRPSVSPASATESGDKVVISRPHAGDPEGLSDVPDFPPGADASNKERSSLGKVKPGPILTQTAENRQQPLRTDTNVTDNPNAAVVADEDDDGTVLVVVPTHYVFIFANPRSGNQQGDPLVKLNIQHYRLKDRPHVQVQIYNFLSDGERTAGLKYVRLLLRKPWNIKKVHVWSAGGDGTLMGVVEGLISAGINVNDPRLLFSVVPFGTGNDLSQVLGWGRFVAGKDVAGHHLEGLNDIVIDRLEGHEARLDVWEVEIETNDGGWIREAGKETKIQQLRRKMSNYSSIGIQGMVGAGFEANRRGSRVLNAMEYARQSMSLIAHGAPRVSQSVESIEHEGVNFEICHRRNLKVRKAPVELVIQNIPGMWGRHVDLWGEAKMSPSILKKEEGPTDIKTWTPNTAYDGKLEIFGISSLRSYLAKQLPWGRGQLQRVGQFASPTTVHFKPSAHYHIMIDGEFYEIYNAKTMRYTRVMQIMLVGPDPEKKESRLVSDETENRADMPGPRGNGTREGVDFEVADPEGALSPKELEERKSIMTDESEDDDRSSVESFHLPEENREEGERREPAVQEK
ncbi:hypothetical protein HK104_002397 [Borealophlyctis nickersoniae]|nr:hypothetical protein HK104_002397 [Borealophlyctis nickersoniae]